LAITVAYPGADRDHDAGSGALDVLADAVPHRSAVAVSDRSVADSYRVAVSERLADRFAVS
jgi:hypothetical protein